MKTLKNTIWTSVGLFALAALLALPATADQQILDDLIVDGSICVGQDCVNGESFGFDTLRLKENNLRIRAVDTSSTSSFPTRDWQITFNDSSNGGANKFSIDNIDNGKTPFTIEDGARTNALYVEDDGDIGVGTSTPVADIHVKTGNTPTLRLEQDGSSGFTAQTWDVAGNEANFFIRDASNGSTLPIRLRPGAPSSSIDIAASGNVGFGSDNPSAAVHIKRTNATARLLVEEASTTSSPRAIISAINNGAPKIEMTNTDGGEVWDFRMNNANDFSINNPGGLGVAFRIDEVSGDAFVTAGQLQVVSSREKKENFADLDAAEILDLVGALPVTSWSYKKDAKGTRHIGPVAEDFHATFGVGPSPRFLSPSDVSGVALAAIQGLHQAVQSKDARIGQLEQANTALEARLAALEAALGVSP